MTYAVYSRVMTQREMLFKFHQQTLAYASTIVLRSGSAFGNRSFGQYQHIRI